MSSFWPDSMVLPRYSTVRVAVRAMFLIGLTQWSISSTAGTIRERSALRRSQRLGPRAERVADHDQRHPRGDVPDEVAFAALAHLVDERMHDLVDARLLLAHPVGRESLRHQLAPVAVLGVVHVDHHRDRPGVGPD